MNSPNVKVCSKCGELRAIWEFTRAKESVDGYKNQCNKCNAEKMAEWYQKNKKKCTERSKKNKRIKKERMKSNPEELERYRELNRIRSIKYRKNNRKKVLISNRKYRENNREKVNKQCLERYHRLNDGRVEARRKEIQEKKDRKYQEKKDRLKIKTDIEESRVELFNDGFIVCPKCNQTKKIEQFATNKKNRTGYSYICKECKNAYKSGYVNENKYKIAEYEKEYQKEYHELHPEKRRETSQKNIKDMSDVYIKGMFNKLDITRYQITPELIELKRVIIKAKRELKNQKTLSV